MTAATVFIVQALYVFLIGLQSRFVHHGNYALAACNSGLLGLAGLYLTTHLARAAVLDGGLAVQVAYVAGGPPAIVAAMLLHSACWKGRHDD